jgi:hypothetical protein
MRASHRRVWGVGVLGVFPEWPFPLFPKFCMVLVGVWTRELHLNQSTYFIDTPLMEVTMGFPIHNREKGIKQ